MSDPLTQIVSLLRPDLSFSKYVEGAGAWRVRRSEQGRPFFCAVLEGAPWLDVPGREPLSIQAGDCVLIPAAYDFTWSSAQPALAGDRETTPTQVRPSVFRLGDPASEPDVRMLIGYCAFGSPDAALLVSLLPALIHARGEGRLTTIIELAIDEFRADRSGREVVLARLMEVAFIEALRLHGADCPQGVLRGLGDARIAAAVRCIHAEPDAGWTVPRLAKAAAMSRSAFFKRFRETVGMAPMEYVLHWRMVLAKRHLQSGGASVAEVARIVGYGSQSTFSVAFSRHVGRSPRSFARAQMSAPDIPELVAG